MKQKHVKPGGGGRKFVAHASQKKKELVNPFDKFANAKKKHDVLNRRVKGEDRNVGRAREKAIDERKTKLLKDYQRSKKSNTFLDKRFGESDANLSLEEKMFMRFQQERVKKVRNSSQFNLDSHDTEVLTHKGQQLGDANMDDSGWVSSDEEGGGKLDKDVVNKLHFGGGLVDAKPSAGKYGPAAEEEDNSPRKGRLEALQEIVMKSKLHKLQKKEAKEEQEDEREKLDKAFEDLFAARQIDVTKPQRVGHTQRGRRGEEEDDEALNGLDAYDVSLREMAYETKARPSDRTRTAEELALAERQRIEELEKARLKRMRQANSAEDPDADEALRGKHSKGKGGGSSTGNRAKHVTDDMIDELPDKRSKKASQQSAPTEEDSEEDDDQSGDGSDDEQGVDDQDEEDEDDEEDEEYSDEEHQEEEEEEQDDDEYSEDDEAEDEEAPDYDEEIAKKKQNSGLDDRKRKGTNAEEEEEESAEESESAASDEDERKGGRFDRRRKKKSRTASCEVEDGANLSMPHKITAPADMEAFDALVARHVRCAADMPALITRILAWNSVHLPGAEGVANRNVMHNFLDVLLKLFVRVGDSLATAPDASAEATISTQLDFLCSTIFTLSEQMGEACVALWGRTLKILQSQLQKRLRDYSLGQRESCWPSLGRLLLLQTLGRVFSVTDLKNDIVSPAALFLCQCVAQCPVTHAKELSSGLLACDILVTYTAETKRFVPEVLTFAHAVVASFLPAQQLEDRRNLQSTFNATSLAWLRPLAAEYQPVVDLGRPARIAWHTFGSVEQSAAAAAAMLHSTYTLIDALLTQHEQCSAAPELFTPIIATLRAIRPQSKPKLCGALQLQHAELLERIIAVSESRRIGRTPLQWRKPITVSIDMKNPRFQLDYSFKKDTDPDQDRVKLKQLNRQFKREKKAAMRELRRDSDFIDQERFREVSEAKQKRQDERVRNFGWMEAQQATINQQVRQGKGLMKGGGSGAAKKARVKRL